MAKAKKSAGKAKKAARKAAAPAKKSKRGAATRKPARHGGKKPRRMGQPGGGTVSISKVSFTDNRPAARQTTVYLVAVDGLGNIVYNQVLSTTGSNNPTATISVQSAIAIEANSVSTGSPQVGKVAAPAVPVAPPSNTISVSISASDDSVTVSFANT